MKYIKLIVVIFLLTSCSHHVDYTFYTSDNIPNNSIRFIRTDIDTSILINKDDIYYLLLLNDENINDINVDYIIKYRNIKTSINAEEYLLKDKITINNIEFNKDNKIDINLNEYKICIYLKELSIDDFEDCNFIYLYNPDKNFYITLNSDLLGLIYNSYTKFNYKFLHHLATVWIETHTIDKNTYLTINIDDNIEVTSRKIRTKTIHKK